DDGVRGAALLLDLADDLLGAVAVQVVDPHLGAGAGELDADRPTHAPPAAARHDGDAPGDEVRPVANRGHGRAHTSMTTGMIAGRRFVRSLMKRPRARRPRRGLGSELV